MTGGLPRQHRSGRVSGALTAQAIDELLAEQRGGAMQEKPGERIIGKKDEAGRTASGKAQPTARRSAKKAEPQRNELAAIEANFHAVIRGRAAQLIEQHGLTLPQLDKSILGETRAAWFPIPGMTGGFKYWLERRGLGLVLITESWCRVVGGSGERHEVTDHGAKLVEEGF
jgi:hypothetical protein